MRFNFGPTDIPRWKWQQFPDVTYDEYQYIDRNTPILKRQLYAKVPNESIKYDNNQVDNVPIGAVTDSYYEVKLKTYEGRFLMVPNQQWFYLVLGYEIASKLFGDVQRYWKEVRIYGRKFNVIGVLKRRGRAFGNSKDTSVWMPVNVVRRFMATTTKNLPRL